VKSTFTESQCVAELFKMYQELTKWNYTKRIPFVYKSTSEILISNII
jgi:hypothetical protein